MYSKRVGFSLFISIAAFLILLWYVGFTKVSMAIAQIVFPVLLIFVFLISPITEFIDALRWKLVLSPLSSISLFATFKWVVFGDFLNFIFPIGVEGDIARAAALSVEKNTKFAPVLSTVGIERVIDAVIIATMGVIAAGFLSFQFSSEITSVLRLVFIGGLTTLFTIYLSVIEPRFPRWFIGKTMFFVPKSLSEQVITFTEGMVSGARAFASLKSRTIIYLGLTILTWILPVFANMMVFAALGLSVNVWVLVLASCLMDFSAVTPSPPLSVGSYEVIWGVIYAALGINAATAIAAGILSHIIILIWVLPIGITIMSRFGFSMKTILKRAKQSKTKAASYGREYFEAQKYAEKKTAVMVLYRQILQWAKIIPENVPALDVGAAFGYTVLLLKELGYDAVGMDISKFACEQANKLTGVNVKEGNIEKSPFPSTRFNLITAFEVLEHTEHPSKALSEIHRMLKNNGVLVMTGPTRFGSFITSQDEHHPSLLSSKQWCSLLTDAGFIVDNVQFYGLTPRIHDRYFAIHTRPIFGATNILMCARKTNTLKR